MSYKAYRDSQRLEAEESYEAIIMVYMRGAEGEAKEFMIHRHPNIWKELVARYNLPGGKLEDER